VRYSAVSARYKIYIIDEVHMLSKNAFNALLKTLEEPPQHVKFLFATTEVNKIPVTILSRCQRFDLRRIPGDALQAHFTHVVEAEGVSAEPAALALIASAAEGSARDGLSILDQAIAHAELSGEQPHVAAEQVRQMLGLADRSSVRRLMGHLLAGDAGAVLDSLAEQHRLGVDPAAIIADLLDLVHAITLAKSGRVDDDPARSAEECAALEDWSGKLGFTALHRLWQLLLKGHGEILSAVNPRDACDMALLRVVHAAGMPDPSDLARMLGQGGAPAAAPAPIQPPAPPEEPGLPGLSAPALPQDFPALISRLEDAGQHRLALELIDCVGLVGYTPSEIELRPLGPLEFGNAQIEKILRDMTGSPWRVTFSQGPAQPSLREQEQAREKAAQDAILAAPAVRAVFEAFPDAELVGIEPANHGSAKL
jgi:DNA polymerase-3 subunit gamma/tau